MTEQRNIKNYTQVYMSEDFEKILVQYRYRKILEIMNSYKPKHILEIGCGLDSIANHYRDYESFTIVEPSEEFINTAQNQNLKNVTFIQGFCEEKLEELSQKKYDFILLSSLLHEVPFPKKLLNVLHQLAAPETIIHINVPNCRSFHLLWAYHAGMLPQIGSQTERAKQLQQNTTFDLKKLNQMVSDAFFRIIDAGSYFIKPFNHAKMSQCVAEGIITKPLLDGLYKLGEALPPPMDFGAEIYINCKKA